MNFQEIINKYHYSEELASFLREIYDEFVSEFGKEMEPIIYEAFLNTEIVSCDNIYTCLKSRGMLENEAGDSMVSEGDLKRATGVYKSYPNISYNQETKEFKINSVHRVVAINNLDLRKNYVKGALIHELGHMIKGYYNEFSIEGNILITRSGLIETQEELIFENNQVIRKVIAEKGVGLEEGLNSVLEEDVARRLVDSEYRVSGYGVVTAVARNFTKKEELKRIIMLSQMLKNKDECIKAFNDYCLLDDAYETLEGVADKLYYLGLKQFSEMFEPDKMRATGEEIHSVIVNEYNSFIERISEARDKNREV